MDDKDLNVLNEASISYGINSHASKTDTNVFVAVNKTA